MGKAIGIDLGTTNCCVTVLEGGTVQIVPNKEGGRTTPTVVGFTEKGERLVGQIAKRQAVTNAANTVYAVKRLIGRKFDSPEVAKMRETAAFEIVDSPNGDARVRVQGRNYSPPELSGIVLQRLKAAAEDFLGESITDAIITVPAYFDDTQRQATKDAGKIAGLKVERIINEPTAAALAYGLGKSESERIAVYDLGGGTFDISILKLISTEEGDIYQVLSTNGDTHLGGDDIDNLLQAFVHEKILQEDEIDFSPHGEIAQELRKSLIALKHELSERESATLRFPLPNGKLFTHEFTRGSLDALIRPVVDRTMKPVKLALADAKLKPEEMDEVVLVGGTTRTPLIRKTAQDFFQRVPHTDLNPDEVVALGAAVQANILDRGVSDMLLLDVTPLSLGIETYGGAVAKIIPRNSTIPASATEQFTTAVDGQKNVLIHVVQGERELVKDCRSLARFDLKDLPPMPAGLARIDVRFLIDANGILNVTARDVRTGKEQSMDVKPSYGLSDQQVEAMILESFEKAQDDFKERQVREARVEADSILAAVKKARNDEAFTELPADQRAVIDRDVQELLTVYNQNDHLLIREKIDQLNTSTHTLAENMMNTAVRGALKGTKI